MLRRLLQIRQFSSSTRTDKSHYSIKHPVHHVLKYKKTILQPRNKKVLLVPEWSPESHHFKPDAVLPSRVETHWQTTIAPDVLLANYVHNERVIPGRHKEQWDGSSAYHKNRRAKLAAGVTATPNIHPRTDSNVPRLSGIWVNTFVKEATESSERVIPMLALLQQITGIKPKLTFSKASIVQWRLRRRKVMGCKVYLDGFARDQFFATLVELVLPRVKSFAGIKNSSGDKFGNITIGFEPEHLAYFPEYEGNPALWHGTTGMNVTFVTSAQTDPEARTFLSAMGIPFVGRERFHNVPKLPDPNRLRKKGLMPDGY
ncbi:mitochondrial 54S ribosomal protein uL5m [Lipomyces oligophaga]|uniref:mitochondrial 54S ribosomal protein uL5m n=1 Tax=Lipomyces oligophaga TaxID=45792 RepID=UPI0034CDF1B2